MPRLFALLALFVAAPAFGQSTLLQTFAAPEPAAGDAFGRAVALSGDYVVIGAPGDQGLPPGQAHVYFRAPDSGAWDLDAELEPTSLISASGIDPEFGAAVALGGRNALVGAPFESGTEMSSGAAYIFRRDEETLAWIDFAKFKAPTPGTGDQFGAAVALSGGTAVIGAYGDDGDGENAGAVYTYTQNVESGAWTFAQRLTPDVPEPNRRFGYAVAVSGDLLLVGTLSESEAGAAYVFERENADSPWMEVQRLVADVADPGDLFGAAVATDGSTILVGAPFDGPDDQGAAFAFARTGEDDAPWVQTQRLIADAPQSDAYFGAALSVEGDRAVIGAPLDGVEVPSGGVYTYEQIGGGLWDPTGRLGSGDPETGPSSFGAAVALSTPLTLVGAPDGNFDDPGAAYIFSLAPTASEDGTTTSTFGLETPFPNPARDAATIAYTLDARAEVSLVAYDLLGREVATLRRAVQPAGRHTIRWPTDDLPPGVYVVRLAGEEQTATRKLVVLR